MRQRHCCHSAFVLRALIKVVHVMAFGTTKSLHQKNECIASCQELPLSHALMALVRVMTSLRTCVCCNLLKICLDSSAKHHRVIQQQQRDFLGACIYIYIQVGICALFGQYVALAGGTVQQVLGPNVIAWRPRHLLKKKHSHVSPQNNGK